jgi:STE24 endopeptidase
MSTAVEPAPAESQHYQRLKHRALFVNLALNFAGLVLAALVLGPRFDGALRPLTGNGPWLRLALLGLVYGFGLELLTLPVDFWSGYLLEHRFGLSRQSLGAWLWKKVKGWLLLVPFGLAVLFGLYALLNWAGPWWWVWAAGAWLLVVVVLGQLLPVLILPLFYRVERLDDSGLLDRFRGLAAGTGLAVEGVYRLGLSDETKKANAALAGLGRTRRVLLGDTLLSEFTPEEIDVVFAHELGHHVHRHLPKMIAVEIVLSAAGLWLADRALHALAPALGYAGPTDPAALPLLLLVLSAFALLVMPAQNALSRRFERQCDRYALERTANPAAYRSAFTKLAEQNKSDPDPHPLVVWLFHDHPPIGERIGMAGSA